MGVVLNACLIMAGWDNVKALFITAVIFSLLYDFVRYKFKKIIKNIQGGHPDINTNNKLEALKGVIVQHELLSHVEYNYLESFDNLIVSVVMSAGLLLGMGINNSLLCTIPLCWYIFSMLVEINLLSEIQEHKEMFRTDNLNIVIRDPDGNPLDEEKTEELLKHLNNFIQDANSKVDDIIIDNEDDESE